MKMENVFNVVTKILLLVHLKHQHYPVKLDIIKLIEFVFNVLKLIKLVIMLVYH